MRVSLIFCTALLTSGCNGQGQVKTISHTGSMNLPAAPEWFTSDVQGDHPRLVDPHREADISAMVSVVEPRALLTENPELAGLLEHPAEKVVVLTDSEATALRNAMLSTAPDAEAFFATKNGVSTDSRGAATFLSTNANPHLERARSGYVQGYFLVDSVVHDLVSMRYEIRAAAEFSVHTLGGRAELVHGESYVRVGPQYEGHPVTIIILETAPPAIR